FALERGGGLGRVRGLRRRVLLRGGRLLRGLLRRREAVAVGLEADRDVLGARGVHAEDRRPVAAPGDDAVARLDAELHVGEQRRLALLRLAAVHADRRARRRQAEPRQLLRTDLLGRDLGRLEP